MSELSDRELSNGLCLVWPCLVRETPHTTNDLVVVCYSLSWGDLNLAMTEPRGGQFSKSDL